MIGWKDVMHGNHSEQGGPRRKERSMREGAPSSCRICRNQERGYPYVLVPQPNERSLRTVTTVSHSTAKSQGVSDSTMSIFLTCVRPLAILKTDDLRSPGDARESSFLARIRNP